MGDQNPGTEYTLQGVMRFLQVEWHNHERARNAWDIERAEMKAKIAKQEGDYRSSRKLTEMLDKQVRMLEKALKHERSKNRANAAGQEPPSEELVRKAWNGKIGVPHTDNDTNVPPLANQDNERDADAQPDPESEARRDKSKAFLQQCVNELSYLLQPPSHPPIAQQYPPISNGTDYHQDFPHSMSDPYSQQAQQFPQSQNRRDVPTAPSQLPSLPNHNPPHHRYVDYQHSQIPHHSRQHSGDSQPAEAMSLDMPQHHEYLAVRNSDEGVGGTTQSYDSQDQQLPNPSGDLDASRSIIVDDANGWNFDETNTILETPSELPKQESENFLSAKSPPRTGPGSHHRRKSSSAESRGKRRTSDGAHEIRELSSSHGAKGEPPQFRVRFALRGHLDVVRSVIFTGGGSPSEPELCTTGDDGTIKRWTVPASSYSSFGNKTQTPSGQSQPQTASNDLDIQSYCTHRGHDGIITCLAACPATLSFSTGGRAQGDGWIFSGGQDCTIRVWERGRVDPKATMDGHTDAIWAICVLPAHSTSISPHMSHESLSSPAESGSPPSSASSTSTANSPREEQRITLVSGSADSTIKIWAVSAPPQLSSPAHSGSGSISSSSNPANRRGAGGSRRHSVTSGSGFPSSPQPSTASNTAFSYSLLHSIDLGNGASPTSITPMGNTGECFVVGLNDARVLLFDASTGEELRSMASQETYDGTAATGVNSVIVASAPNGTGVESGTSAGSGLADPGRQTANSDDGEIASGPTGILRGGGLEGTVISGHEDRFVRFFDANSGQNTYTMLAHPSPISTLSLSPDGRELVSAGHDASLRFWSLEKRACAQEITSHRVCRGEGVCCAVWSFDGRWVVSAGGDGVVKVFGR